MNLLDRYPQIELELSGRTIVSILFKNLQPSSFSSEMQLLQIESINDAIKAISTKMSRKDVALAENHTSTSTSKPPHDSTPKKKGCLNCNQSKDSVNKNHSIWKCRNIEFCCRCNKKHLALGPSCPHKDLKIFNYDKYLEQKKTYNTLDLNGKISQPNNIGKSYNKGTLLDSFGEIINKTYNKSTDILPSLYLVNTAQTPSIISSNRDDLDRQMLQTLQSMNSELKKFNGSEVSTHHKILDHNSLIIDTGANETCINSTSHSVSPIIFNRMEDRTNEDHI